MYKGEGALETSNNFIGVSLTVSHYPERTIDAETDEPVSTTPTSIILAAYILDLSEDEREYFFTKYNTNKIVQIRVSGETSVDIEDNFEHNNRNYTVLQKKETITRTILYCKYEPRL